VNVIVYVALAAIVKPVTSIVCFGVPVPGKEIVPVAPPDTLDTVAEATFGTEVAAKAHVPPI
jgi:hypothetical protein